MKSSLNWREHYYAVKPQFWFFRGVVDKPRKVPLIITLTTIPARLPTVHIMLGALLSQSIKPDRIVLWIGEDIDGKLPELPKTLTRLYKRGIEIYARPDIGPHTKLIYALKEYPDAIHVTADDDRIYGRDWLKGLYEAHLLQPAKIICYRARSMKMAEDGKLLPSMQWDLLFSKQDTNGLLLFPTGTGGVLYPPRCFPAEVFNEDVFKKLCPKQDDIWFKAMSLLKNVTCQKIPASPRNFPHVSKTQESGLWNYNKVDNNNDKQLAAVFNYYNIEKKLSNQMK